jgi:Co/Zn/Cd efflux system component
MKVVAFMGIAIITFIYVLGELGIAVYINSLVLLSDGFHNLSDVVSLYIAFWANRVMNLFWTILKVLKASKRESSNEMSYGWARTEILGGLTNGCFLLSLCLYVVLESIPKFIRPERNFISPTFSHIIISNRRWFSFHGNCRNWTYNQFHWHYSFLAYIIIHFQI